MSAVDEEIVREYFEQNGFLVRQVRKYQVQSRKKTSDEEIDLLVYNPTYVKSGRKPDFFVFPSELPYIHRAMVAVKAWHTGKLNPATIRSSPDILRFLEEQVQKEAHRLFAVETLEQDPNDEMLKILVTPGLPTQEPYRSQSVSLLQDGEWMASSHFGPCFWICSTEWKSIGIMGNRIPCRSCVS